MKSHDWFRQAEELQAKEQPETGILRTILHTKDGGETWQNVPLPNSGGLMGKQAAVGPTYFLQCSNYVYRTDNAGKTWQVLTDKFPASGPANQG